MLNLADESILDDHAADRWRLPPDQPVWKWMEQSVYLSELETDFPGYWRSRITPFAREPLECFRERRVRSMVLMFATQVAKTIILTGGTSWSMVHKALRVQFAFDSEGNALDYSKTRFQPIWDHHPLSDLKMASENTNLNQALAGSLLKFTGANSEGKLAGTPSRLQIGDEVEKWPTAALYNLAQRGKARAGGLRVWASSPGIASGPINTEFMAGDQRFYYLPCWFCESMILLEKKGLVWSPDARISRGVWDLDTVRKSARYLCPKCQKQIDENQKVRMVRADEAEWRPHNPHADTRDRSYCVNSLYSPWESCTLGNLAVEILNGRAKGMEAEVDKNAFAIPEQDETIELTAEDLTPLVEPFKSKDIWDKVLVLTVGVDRQADRLEAELIGWGVGTESWSLAYEVFPGDPNQTEVWKTLDEWILRARPLKVLRVGVDSGDEPDSVYKYALRKKSRGVWATRGYSHQPTSAAGRPVLGTVSTNNAAKCPVQYIGTFAAKKNLFQRIAKRLENPSESGPRVPHWPGPGSSREFKRRGAEYFALLTGERLTHKRVKGYKVEYFEATGRNEAIDTWVIAYAMLLSLGTDYLEAAQIRREEDLARKDKPKQSAPARRKWSASDF